MKFFQTQALIAAIFLILAACSKDQSGSGSRGAPPALPASWLNGSDSDSSSSLPPATAEATQSVQAAFHAHTSALEEVLSKDSPAATVVSAEGHPADWVPWHLDGMIAAFGVDVGGIFGTLLADANPAVKITWQRQVTPSPAPRSPRATSVRFHPGLTSKDVAALVEPAVQMAVATKSVGNADNMRRNLYAEGQKFLSLVRVLSAVSPGPAWHIDGYQNSISLTAAGDISPAINIGGTFLVIFDWQAVPNSNPIVSTPLDERERALQLQATDFARTMETLLPQASAESSEIRKAGFEFQVFQVGLGISVGGDIGIATGQVWTGGRIIFKKGDSSGLLSATDFRSGFETVPMIAVDSGAFPAATMVSSRVVQVPFNRFRNSLSRAIQMGTFFARQALAVETKNWKTTEIELGLDASIGGQIGLINVAGSGLIRIGLERVE